MYLLISDCQFKWFIPIINNVGLENDFEIYSDFSCAYDLGAQVAFSD
jgi:hypothetical protein